MDIKDLTYKQFALIRKAVIDRREKVWKDKTTPFPLKKVLQEMPFDKVKKIKREFDTTTNQLKEEGVCNVILKNLEKIEMNIQKEFKK